MSDRATSLEIIQEARICLLAGAVIKGSSDPADALLVLFSSPLSALHGRPFLPTEFAAKVKESFGWELSTEAITYFIPKLRNLGWLKSNPALPARGPYIVDLPQPETSGREGVDTQLQLEQLGRAFIEHGRRVSPISVLPDSPLEAGAILLRQVVDANEMNRIVSSKPSNDEEYLCASFIEEVNKKKLPEQQIISSLSAVGFLFRVAEEIGSPTRVRRVALKVIVDGPLLLDFLRCSGETRFNAANDLFADLKSNGCVIVTFTHCVDEAREALQSVLKRERSDRYGPTADALRQGIVHENVLLALVNAFEQAVKGVGIDILTDTIEYLPSSHKHFDNDYIKELRKIVNWHEPEKETARTRDVNTTVFTLRRRAGNRTTDIFDSQFVCVTSNESFAGRVRRFLLENAYYNERQIPPVVALKELAAKVWMEVGNRSRANRFRVPDSQLLLSCDRSLQLNRRVVEKAKNELARSNPVQLKQFELLLELPRSARAVMDMTLNNDRYVSGDNITQLLEAAVEAAGAELAEKERIKRAKDKLQFTATLAQERVGLEEAKAAVAAERGTVASQALEIQRAKDAETEMLDALASKASVNFRYYRFMFRLAAVSVAAIPVITLIGIILTSSPSGIVIIISLLTIAFGILGAMDIPGSWLSKLIERWLEERLVNTLKSISRVDLANRISVSWRDGIAYWQMLD